MDVVPEFAKPGEPQILVGDPACPVIDHENEPASQQQQPHQTEKPADHASPCYLFALRPAWLKRRTLEIQPRQHLNRPSRTFVRQLPGPESVDAARAALY